jgi:sulfonate transport system substrate-binding protein
MEPSKSRLLVLLIALAALAAPACGNDTTTGANTAVSAGGTATAGATASASGGSSAATGSNGMLGGAPPTTGNGGVPSSGGAPSGLAGGAGATVAGGAGGSSATGGTSAGGTAGAGNAMGGAGGMGGASGASGAGSYPRLSLYGNTTTLELAPLLVAAMSLYPGMATVKNGGIPNLWSGADAATNAETQALVQSVTHPNLRIVFTVSEGLYRIVARRSSGITTLADLRGKRVATVPSTSSAYYLHRMLATVQLTESDVTVVAAAMPSSMPGSLTRHEVDAATIWEPEIQNAADALGSDAIQFQDPSVYRELFNLNTTAEKLADPTTRRGIVELVRSLVKASAQITAQPSGVFSLVASTTGYDAALVAKSFPYERFSGTLVPDLLDVLEAEEAWLAKNGTRAARDRATLAMLIDDTALKDAMTSP